MYHEEVGYNFRMPNILAAMGLAQLEIVDEYLVPKASVASSTTYKLCFLAIILSSYLWICC